MNQKSRTLRGIPAVVAAVLVLVLVAILWLALWGVVLGAANAWIIQGTFTEAWSAVWRRWPISLLWGLLFGVGTRVTR